MRDCYIRCLKNGDSENIASVLPCSCSPPQDNKAADAEPITENNKVDEDNAKESVAASSSTSDAGKHAIISPREIEACIYYPELKSLLSGTIAWQTCMYVSIYSTYTHSGFQSYYIHTYILVHSIPVALHRGFEAFWFVGQSLHRTQQGHHLS